MWDSCWELILRVFITRRKNFFPLNCYLYEMIVVSWTSCGNHLQQMSVSLVEIHFLTPIVVAHYQRTALCACRCCFHHPWSTPWSNLHFQGDTFFVIPAREKKGEDWVQLSLLSGTSLHWLDKLVNDQRIWQERVTASLALLFIQFCYLHLRKLSFLSYIPWVSNVHLILHIVLCEILGNINKPESSIYFILISCFKNFLVI